MSLRIVRLRPAFKAMCRSMSSKTGEPKNIGFIGVGRMGYAMSGHLMNKGHKLHIYDTAKEPVDKLSAMGATPYDNVVDLSLKSDFVITMLPSNAVVLETYKNLAAGQINPDTMFIDTSTGDPNLSNQCQALICEKGAVFVDSPVSGGVPGAEKATLTFMVGGTKDDYEKVAPILQCMGKSVVHCGGTGMGQAAKLCNNMMLGISMVGICETMNLAIRLGLDPKLFASIINSSTGRCWSSDSYNPVPGIIPDVPSSNNYEGGFPCELMTKDLGLAAGVAASSNTPTMLGAAAHQIFRFALSKGFAQKDFSYIYQMLKDEQCK